MIGNFSSLKEEKTKMIEGVLMESDSDHVFSLEITIFGHNRNVDEKDLRKDELKAISKSLKRKFAKNRRTPLTLKLSSP